LRRRAGLFNIQWNRGNVNDVGDRVGENGELAMSFRVRSLVAAAMLAAIAPSLLLAEDGVSINGTYVQNTACKGDGSDPAGKLVKIGDTEIHSSFGVCTFLKKERDGKTVAAQMSCNGPGGNILLGDVRFTVRDDNKTIDFIDQDNTYRAVLYRCPQGDAARQSQAGPAPNPQ
jgi:hypothetical protein